MHAVPDSLAAVPTDTAGARVERRWHYYKAQGTCSASAPFPTSTHTERERERENEKEKEKDNRAAITYLSQPVQGTRIVLIN